MSSYSDGYADGRGSASSGWGDFFGFMFGMFCIIMVGRMIGGWGAEAERARIDKLLQPYGITVEHLERQAEIRKNEQLAKPIMPGFSTVEKTK